MKNEINISNRQQQLDRLCRAPSEKQIDTSILSSPGTSTSIWAVMILSNASYNVYNVVNVVIGEPGSEPVAMGMQTQAVNLAEPFDQQGTLSYGKYVVMSRIGNNYIFYAEP